MKKLKNIFYNSAGLSMVEIIMGLGITAAAGLGIAHMMKEVSNSKRDSDSSLNRKHVERAIERAIVSEKGCKALKDAAKEGNSLELVMYENPNNPDDKIILKEGAIYGQGSADIKMLNKFIIKELKFSKYLKTQSDVNGSNGVAIVRVVLKRENPIGEEIKKLNYRDSILEFPLSVNMDKNDNVTGCLINPDQVRNLIIDKVCKDAFGKLYAGVDCAKTLQNFQETAIKEICSEMQNNKNPPDTKLINGRIYCDLSQIHANKTCGSPTEGARGLDPSELKCEPLPKSRP